MFVTSKCIVLRYRSLIHKELQMSKFAVLFATFLAFPAAASAGEIFTHNDSVMNLEWDDEGDGVTITYLKPKKSLNIRPGTVLFEGAVTADGTMYGKAKVFSGNCGSIKYEVYGTYSEDYILLNGEAPIRDKRCNLVAYKWNKNSTLEFHGR